MSQPNPNRTDQAFEAQQDDEEIVEISSSGEVYKAGEAPRTAEQKPSVLRDPEGEF